MVDVPLFSVVVPSFNRASDLAKTLTAILNQSEQSFEVLVIDDASADENVAVARRFAEKDSRVRVLVNEENLGVAATRNRGFSHARGTYIALCDGDDVWEKEKLAQQKDSLQKGVDISYTAYSFIDEVDRPIKKVYHVPERTNYEEMLLENVIGCSTAVFHSKWLAHFQMRADIPLEDYAFWLALLKAGAVAAGIDIPLVQYRVCRTSRSHNKLKAAKNRWCFLRTEEHLGFFKTAYCMAHYAARALFKYRK